MLQNMGLIMFDVNIQKLEEHITSKSTDTSAKSVLETDSD